MYNLYLSLFSLSEGFTTTLHTSDPSPFNSLYSYSPITKIPFQNPTPNTGYNLELNI